MHDSLFAALQVHGTPQKDKSAAAEGAAGNRAGGAQQALPMAPLDPALTVAQQRMNTQGAAKRRRAAAAKPEGAAPKQRCAALDYCAWLAQAVQVL